MNHTARWRRRSALWLILEWVFFSAARCLFPTSPPGSPNKGNLETSPLSYWHVTLVLVQNETSKVLSSRNALILLPLKSPWKSAFLYDYFYSWVTLQRNALFQWKVAPSHYSRTSFQTLQKQRHLKWGEILIMYHKLLPLPTLQGPRCNKYY